MESKKTSRKSIKTVEISVAPQMVSDKPSAESKPVKRAPAKRTVTAKTISVPASEPKNNSHRHSKSSTVSAAPSIDYDAVARLAYKYWEERNYAHGFAEEDWHRAEKAMSAAVGN